MKSQVERAWIQSFGEMAAISDFPKGVPGLLKLQINLNETNMSCESILNYFHNGMVDFIEFRLDESSKIEDMLEKFGEKFLLVGGNMASKSLTGKIYCKIFSSLPQVKNGSYIPARKRIYFDESDRLRRTHLKTIDLKIEAEIQKILKYYQENTFFDILIWDQYRLLGEGHYIQLYGRNNWKMLLPFSGEGEKLDDENIINTDEIFTHDSNADSSEEIPETHRDF